MEPNPYKAPEAVDDPPGKWDWLWFAERGPRFNVIATLLLPFDFVASYAACDYLSDEALIVILAALCIAAILMITLDVWLLMTGRVREYSKTGPAV